MKKLIIVILLFFPALAFAQPLCVEEATRNLKTNSVVAVHLDKREISNFIDDYCDSGYLSAKLYLGIVLKEKGAILSKVGEDMIGSVTNPSARHAD
jgi:hypothetical protein